MEAQDEMNKIIAGLFDGILRLMSAVSVCYTNRGT
jgi:hypothetical protein